MSKRTTELSWSGSVYLLAEQSRATMTRCPDEANAHAGRMLQRVQSEVTPIVLYRTCNNAKR